MAKLFLSKYKKKFKFVTYNSNINSYADFSKWLSKNKNINSFINFAALTNTTYCENNKKLTCMICLKDSDNYDFSYTKLKCGHRFHFNCIKEWKFHGNTCPICRKELSEQFLFEC